MEPSPDPHDLDDEIAIIDTHMAGEPELNAVYLLSGRQPCLVESGPGSDAEKVIQALDELGIGAADLAHIVVTHIHVDHAGGAGRLLETYPRATLWVHERGAAHLVDPTRLVASTERTYGASRMKELYGETRPCPADRIRAVTDGDTIALGDRSLDVLHTPGHASHHVCFFDEARGSMFTGEAIGSYLPWADCYRPALPPPEVDVEAALGSISRLRERHPTRLLTSHFGQAPDADASLARAEARIRTWSARVGSILEIRPDTPDDELEDALHDQARNDFRSDADRPLDAELARYDALGSIGMNARGLGRYWRKRLERETTG
jgi:glyoxylase-like metal-dependent hydrolase (beta-lactamase superfamily II)